jgi:DNA-binding MarR family transcriptional regulator
MSSIIPQKIIEKRFGYILKRAQQSLRTRMDRELKAHELTTPQYAVLVITATSPGISNADLARAAFVTPQTMQGIVSILEKRGLLERVPGHGRRLIAQVTTTGHR